MGFKTTRASDCSQGRSPLLYGVRVKVARGVSLICDASMVMTLEGQTFQENFRGVVSEDLLGDTERIILDKLVSA